MTKHLITEKRFGAFFTTQFLGAFNDNLLKFAVTLAVTFNDSLRGTYSPGLLVNLIAALFILPFFLFSATSGQLADKYDKTQVMRMAKYLEPPIVILTTLGFLLNSVYILMAALFLLGTQAAFFGPAKYAYLPEQMQARELVLANALVETATFVAILLGTIAGGALMSHSSASFAVYAVCGFAFCVALAGVWSSRQMPLTPSAHADLKVNWNFLTETWHNIRFARNLTQVWPYLLGISWLWFVGATYLTQFPLLTKVVLNASPGVATFLLFLFTAGLGLGAFLCERWSHKRIEMGLVPWGLLMMALGGFALHQALIDHQPAARQVDLVQFFLDPVHLEMCFLFLVISVGVGLYSVPLYTAMQVYAPRISRSRVVSANNIVNAMFMVVSAIMSVGILWLTRGKVLWVFAAVTLFNLVILIAWCRRNSYLLLRARLLLRVRARQLQLVQGMEDPPPQGGCLLVFPTLLHTDYLARMSSVSMPFAVVLSGRLKSSRFVEWLRKKEFVFEFSKLSEDASQRQLIQRIAKQIQAGQSIAIDKPMFELLRKQYKLDELPLVLARKGVRMTVLEFFEEKTKMDGMNRVVLRLREESPPF